VEESHTRLLAETGETALLTLSARVVLSAVLARDLGRLDEALAHSEGALRIAEETFRAPSQYTEVFRVRYGKILTLLGRYEEAERALLAARAVLLGLHTARGPYTLKATKGLAQLYESWGRDRDAAHWVSVLETSTAAPVEASARIAPEGADEDG